MVEFIFILLIIYVAYVSFAGADGDKQINKPVADIASVGKIDVVVSPAKDSKKSPVKLREVVTKVKSETVTTKPVKKAKPKKTAKQKVNKKAAPKIELRTVEMKNPKTGEQAKVANNYRMVKRWVKEALVEEGLLDKIYKTNEMDDVAKAKVAEGLSIIKAMDKYKV